MFSMAVAGPITTARETEREQIPPSPRLTLAEPLALAPSTALRPLEVAQCSLCGIAQPLGLLVPDGGEACNDVRWYCKDAKSCTERWTTARPPHPVLALPGPAIAGAGEPAPTGLGDGRLEEAHSAG